MTTTLFNSDSFSSISQNFTPYTGQQSKGRKIAILTFGSTLLLIGIEGVAGVVILTLGLTQTFGPVGSIGFIAAVSGGGGLLASTVLMGVIWIALLLYINKRLLESESSRRNLTPKDELNKEIPQPPLESESSRRNLTPKDELNKEIPQPPIDTQSPSITTVSEDLSNNKSIEEELPLRDPDSYFNFNKLPDELLYYIFQFCSFKNLGSFNQVNSRWNTQAESTQKSRALEYGFNNSSDVKPSLFLGMLFKEVRKLFENKGFSPNKEIFLNSLKFYTPPQIFKFYTQTSNFQFEGIANHFFRLHQKRKLSLPTNETTPKDTLLLDTSDDGKKALLNAIQQNKPVIVKLLLDLGVDPNQEIEVNRQKTTFINIAVKNHFGEIANLLLEAGADLSKSSIANTAVADYLYSILNSRSYKPEDVTSMIKILLKCKADVNTPNTLNQSPILLAVRLRHLDAIALLMEHGAEPDKSYPNQEPVLINFLEKATINNPKPEIATKIVELLLKKADPNLQDSKNNIPLQEAILLANPDIVTLLLKKGADSNKCTVSESTILANFLHQAYISSKAEITPDKIIPIVKILLHHKADPNHTSSLGKTPLDMALKGRNSILIELLIRYGADPNVISEKKGPLLIRYLRESNANKSKIDIMLVHFLATETNVNVPDTDHIFPLEEAVAIGDIELITLLLERGADPNSCRHEKSTILASYLHSLTRKEIQHSPELIAEIVELLLKNGADANRSNTLNYSPLSRAIKLGNISVIKSLIDCGADPNQKYEKQELVLFELLNSACMNKSDLKPIKEIVAILKANPFLTSSNNSTPLFEALQIGDTELIELLLQSSDPKDNKDQKGTALTSFMYAIASGKLLKTESDIENIVRLLLKYGANPNIPHSKSAPLHFASQLGYLKTVEALCAYGADLEAKGGAQGFTPLQFAAQAKKASIIDFLISKGADSSVLLN